jgi:hypothetical protein
LLLAGLPNGIHGDVGDNGGEIMAMRRRPPTDTGKADLFLVSLPDASYTPAIRKGQPKKMA